MYGRDGTGKLGFVPVRLRASDADDWQEGSSDSPPAVRLRDQHEAVTKRVILRAARTRFAERGYAGTSVKDIAAEAEVAVQTLYATFGSKSGVLLGLVDWWTRTRV